MTIRIKNYFMIILYKHKANDLNRAQIKYYGIGWTAYAMINLKYVLP